MVDQPAFVSIKDLGDWSTLAPEGPLETTFGGNLIFEEIPQGGVSSDLTLRVFSGVGAVVADLVLIGVSVRIVTRGQLGVVFERLQLVAAGFEGEDYIGAGWATGGFEPSNIREHNLGGPTDLMGLPGDIRIDRLLTDFHLIIAGANTSSKEAKQATLQTVEVTLHLAQRDLLEEEPRESLLPHNATAQERAIELAVARTVPVGVRAVWDPDTCPSNVLPWLAWALSVDQWNPAWTDEQKRDVIRTAIAVQRQKGTAGAVRDALAALSIDARVVEWHRQQVTGDPYTYRLFVEAAPDAPVTSIAALERAIATVDRVKSLRSHMEDVQVSTLSAGGPRVGAAAAIGQEIVVFYDGQLS